ncbi:hypothetical protein AHF37_11902 [Paragonimus kellicotti]|nr:hypothetical protein AHF37_11902 [Paragonimus kellicotti]
MLALLFPITVGSIWGCTNVLMKYSKTNLQFIFYLLLNQCGSVLFVWGLSSLNLASAVPLANGVTLMVSALLAFCFCDERMGKSGFIGLILLCIGVFLLSASLSPARRLKDA